LGALADDFAIGCLRGGTRAFQLATNRRAIWSTQGANRETHAARGQLGRPLNLRARTTSSSGVNASRGEPTLSGAMNPDQLDQRVVTTTEQAVASLLDLQFDVLVGCAKQPNERLGADGGHRPVAKLG
jgi:hypothetical protein